MSGNHTAGPWRKSGADLDGFIPVMATGGVIVALISMLSPKAEDDARLIAGAPELLVALKACRLELDYCQKQLATYGQTGSANDSVSRALAAGATAIAKATQP